MDQAWLHSLSEDWVSQPRSSSSPAPSLPSLTSNTSNSPVLSSRIPKYSPPKQSCSSDSRKPLAERSSSDQNAWSSRPCIHRASKLRRSLSDSSLHSVTLDTGHHSNSVNVSPRKGPKETPEWKRLVRVQIPVA